MTTALGRKDERGAAPPDRPAAPARSGGPGGATASHSPASSTRAPNATGTIRIRFLTEAEAKRAAAALEPDNDGLLVARVDGQTLILEARGTGLGLLRTLDDALACLRALQA